MAQKNKRVEWMRKQKGRTAGKEDLLPTAASFPPTLPLCLVPSFLWSPPPTACGDHMTAATYITAISKNTLAERFMRLEQGAAHSSSDLAERGADRHLHVGNSAPSSRLNLIRRQTIAWNSLSTQQPMWMPACERAVLTRAIHQKAASHACRQNTLT